ncbi:MAG: hypothetical protein QOK31_1141 [Solirubrobacteraceae bacterium]|jgi:hypothetical protein|nr:hypothetical protein [Solirubrobacteraceae bacterium]
MSQHPDRQSVRRVVLPSGKTIEVVYFEDRAPVPPPNASTPAPSVEGLHVCPQCESDLVQPVEWDEAGPAHWEMTLRCPACEWVGGGIFAQELVERLEDSLDRGTEALVEDLKRLTHANMEDEIDRFVTALAADHVWPMDF